MMIDSMTALLLAPSSTADAPMPAASDAAGAPGWHRNAGHAADAAGRRWDAQERIR
ncbi:hypothetical protein DXO206_010535 [Xanthomonas oryzae pv. oryzae]|uniref:Uncharacterized protein n=1 Tax=Xanthomonas oryzae pv. oryzae TaxID=64187 RepID=A0AAJ5MBS3_XANOO|nr:hypothetical protein IXO35_010700 [Xanthomonas oryzae pv. oryzae]UXV90287.1 hypothetical protein IXO597_011085 [Xanthomonas oryzae pv. oryzae]UXV92779.1 hypothetical protein IXO74_002365 [Xanthomonas oryzae pv. oryzae]UXW01569.1 hypothetical protein IXO792_11420 [Xanthomonas oryzae pv. oryzae]WJS63827.1 hypothetical protein DXO206_010535 [Xanthomonas oryzae pv. oryzae]